MDHLALLACHCKSRAKAQEPKTTESGLGDAHENVGGDNAWQTELPPSHCLWNKIFFVIIFSTAVNSYICGVYISGKTQC